MRRLVPLLFSMVVVSLAATTTNAALLGGDLPNAERQDTAKAKKMKPPQPERTPAEDSVRLDKRAGEAVARPLFATRDPLAFTLTANFGRISRERDSTSKKEFDGTLVVRDEAGTERSVKVKLRTRGHFRLMARTCRFVNLLVRFPDKGLTGTPFEGQKSLKLGAHCQTDSKYEQYLLKEYLAYRIFNLVTDVSFRARLSKGTYMDSASGRSLETRVALWIEHEDDVAARSRGQMRDLRRALFADVDAQTLDQMALFEYAIGNTDWSMYALHNVRVIRQDNGTVLPVPYDFDFSGLVDASYAMPPPQLAIKSVRQRVFRGPCRPPDVITGRLTLWQERRAAILNEVGQVQGLDPREAQYTREYLTEFFDMINDPRQVKRALIDACLDKPGA